MIGIGGPVAILLSLYISSQIEQYAGRERAPDIEQYARAGIVQGDPGIVVAKTKALREFGGEIRTVWESFYPGSVAGLEVSTLLMTIYVTPAIRVLSDSEREALASNTVRALHRRFGSDVCTLLVVEDATTLIEVTYNAMTKSTRVKSFQ